MVEFGILGPLQVTSDGAPVELRRAKQRALLTMLLLHPNRLVSADQLIDALWGDRPPDSAANTLYGYISHVRRALADAGGDGDGNGGATASLRTSAPGYVLDVDPQRIDVWRFERFLADGGRAQAAGDPAAAAAAYSAALRLWRGPALADLPSHPAALAEAARLEELRLGGLEERNVAELALGRHGELVGSLQALVDQHPLRERLWGQLMLALYRCGRQAEALRAFSSARRLLRDELGIDPSPALRHLEADILAQAPALQGAPAAGTAAGAPVAGEASAEDMDLEHPVGASADAVPLPAELEGARWSGLAGRIAEREQLLRSWKEAQAGLRQVVLIGGEAGIGKSRLVSELAHDAHADGARVIFGRSDEELEVPYRPFVDALNQLARSTPGGEGRRDWEGDLSRIVPGFGEGASRADPETERLRLFNAISAWLHEGAAEQGLLVILDDLHWADRSSLLLLRHLVMAMPHSRLMIVGTFRDTDVHRGDPLSGVLAELRRQTGVERITLRGLDTNEIEALLVDRSGIGDAEGAFAADAAQELRNLAQMLYAQTDGNPFFIGELVSSLVEAGAIYRDGGRWRTDPQLVTRLGVPEGVKEVVGRRLSALPPETNDVLACAAIVGAEFDARIVASVLAVDLDRVVKLLERALSRRLVVDVDGAFARYRFAHALVRQTLDEEQSSTQRMRLSSRIALALEDAGAEVTEIAHHFTQAARVSEADAEKAVRYTRRVAREAAERLALDEVVQATEIVLATEALLPPDPVRRAELLLELGEAKNACGRVADGRADFVAAADAVRDHARPDLLARAAVGYAGTLPVWVEYLEVTGPALTVEALAALPEDDSVERVLCLAKLVAWHTPAPDPTARLRLASEAVAMAERLGHPIARISAVTARLWALRGQPGRSAEQMDLAHALKELARATGSAAAEATALTHLVPASHNLDNGATARQALADLEALGERTGLQIALWLATTVQTSLALNQGRFDDLSRLDERERAPGMGEVGLLIADGHQQLAALLREEWEELAESLSLMLRRYPLLLGGWGLRVRIAWARGQEDEAREELATWLREGLPVLASEVRFVAAAYLARPAVDLGMADACRVLEDILEPHRGTWCTTGVSAGFADHALGRLRAGLGDPSEARASLRIAEAAYRQAGTRAWLAICLADLAELAADPAEAAAAATEAAEIAEAIGAPNVARRARAAAGSSP